MTAEPIAPADRWYSGQPTGRTPTTTLTTGTLVIADRRPFRIDRVTELPHDEWPERFLTAWREQRIPDPAEWWSRPYKVGGLFEGPNANDRLHSTIAPADYLWDVLPEHYAVCHRCLELPPCSHAHQNRIAEQATERMERDMAILPGACHGCREPITRRQKSFAFPGPNLIRPDLGDNSAIFHTRGKCYGALTTYDKRWAAAEPDRTRLFYCDGMRIHHYDGTPECSHPECVAKGDMANLVDHRARIWHRPGPSSRMADCWCLKGATQ